MAKTESFKEQAQRQVIHVDAEPVQNNVSQPQQRLFFGGVHPRAGASRPTGYVQVDENGNEIKEKRNVVDDDITNSPEFKAAFGDNSFVADFVNGNQTEEKHKVDIVNVRHSTVTDPDAPIDIGRSK
jgi:hypothetical protein